MWRGAQHMSETGAVNLGVGGALHGECEVLEDEMRRGKG